MNERLKKLQERLLAFWKKYDNKQRTIMISIAAVVILFVVILSVVLTRPKYETLITCGSTTEAATFARFLNGAGIEFKTSSDGLVFEVKEEDLSSAILNWEPMKYLPAAIHWKML
jgi:flagellar M-ring protein FliF